MTICGFFLVISISIIPFAQGAGIYNPPPPPNHQVDVLIVGMRHYDDDYFEITYGHNAADKWAEFYGEVGGVDSITVLKDPQNQGNIESWFTNLNNPDEIIVHLIGHGSRDSDDDEYYFPLKGQFDGMQNEEYYKIRANEIHDWITDEDPSKVYINVDSCHSGQFLNDMFSLMQGPNGIPLADIYWIDAACSDFDTIVIAGTYGHWAQNYLIEYLFEDDIAKGYTTDNFGSYTGSGHTYYSQQYGGTGEGIDFTYNNPKRYYFAISFY